MTNEFDDIDIKWIIYYGYTRDKKIRIIWEKLKLK